MTTLESGQNAYVPKPNARFMLSHPAHLIAQGFGSGLSPIMPGTVGTLLSWLSFNVLTSRWPGVFTPLAWSIIIIAGFLVGVWACRKTSIDLGMEDHGSLVWDEIIAFWLVLVFVMPASLGTQLWAFVLFRAIDMIKPMPIRQVEKRLKGGFGVMADDILAAFYTLLLFAIWENL